LTKFGKLEESLNYVNRAIAAVSEKGLLKEGEL
jgi:hypothetical protein